MSEKRLSKFFRLLTNAPAMADVFNPWKEVDPSNDRSSQAPRIRRAHLRHYISSRLNGDRAVLIGEAVGYRGARFSGIPMTSERILLGYLRNKGINPSDVLPEVRPRRTSRIELAEQGFTEPTATIVWGTVAGSPRGAGEVVLWNAFAWHPFHPKKGMLSNRTPRKSEMQSGTGVLRAFLDLFPGATVIAMGRVAERGLKDLDVDCRTVRHPAQGGAGAFRRQIRKILT